MRQIDWVGGVREPRQPAQAGNKRPSVAEEKAKLCLQLGNMVRKVPPAYSDWSYERVVDFKRNQEAAIKVVMKKNATATEYRCAINNMQRFWGAA
jgi:hypothetical protein